MSEWGSGLPPPCVRKCLTSLKALLLLLVLGLSVNVWGEIASTSTFTEKSFSNLSDGDVVIFASSSNKAMSNATQTTGKPAQVGVTISGNAGSLKITPASGSLDGIAWTLAAVSDGFTFYQYGSTTNRLCITVTNSNTAAKVTDATSSFTTMAMGNSGKNMQFVPASRFLGCYTDGSDWRTYNTEEASNYGSTSTKFYVLNTSTPTPSKELVSIAISGTPNKTAYETGEEFDHAGLTVTGTYDDESTSDLTDDAEWTIDPATFTSTSQTSVSVTATVDGKSDTKNYAVTVTEFVQTYANTYTSDASLSSVITGSKVKWEGCKVTDGYAALKIAKAGTATITVPAGTKTVHLHMVAWNGESANVTVKLGSTTLPSIKPTADAGVSGTSTTYTIATEPKTENSYYFAIEVNADEATTLSLTTASNKRAILFGVNFEEVPAVYSAITLATCENGSVSVTGADDLTSVASGTEITLSNTPATGYKLDAYDVYKTGESATKVTIENGKFKMPAYPVTVSATFKVAKVLNSVEITTPATKTEFWKGEEFSAEGLVLTAHFANGDEVVTPTSITGYDMATAGEQTVTVSFTEGATTKSDTYDIKVKSIANTKETAYTVAQAIAIVDANPAELATQDIYVKGIVISASAIGTFGNSNIDVKDPNTDGSAFVQFFRCLDLGNKNFTEDYVGVGDTVIALGKALYYSQGKKYELNQGCYLVEYKKFTAQKVDISNTPETAYTPAKAIELYNDPTSDLTKAVYVKGVVTTKPSMTTNGDWKGSYYQVKVAAAETETPTFVFFHMFAGAESAQFTEDIVNAKDTLIAYGTLTKYQTTYELAERCYMYERKAYVPKVTGVTIDNKEGLTVPANESITLTATITEEGAEGTLVWSVIAGDAYASVDQDGKVSGIAAGEATIQVQVQGTEFTDQCTVTVTAADLRKTATITSFEEKEGALTPNDITYVGEKGFAANETAVFNNNLRLYQNGGLVTIAAVKGCKIDEVIITTSDEYTSTTAALTTTRQASKPASGVTIAKSTQYSFGTGLNADTAFIYCLGTDKNTRLEIASIVVKYTGEPAAVESLSLSGEYQTEFQKGDEFNHDGMVVTANYTGGDKVDVTANAEFSTPDMTTEGDQTVTVSFGGKSKDYTISILPAILEELVLSGEYQTIFQMGEEFNHTGLVVTAVYSDETDVDVTAEAIVSTPDMTVAGNKEVTVSYGGKETSYTISVKAQSGSMPKEKVDLTEVYAGVANGTDLTQEAYNPYSGASFSLTYSKGTATSNVPKYYTSATQGQTVRAYEGNTITITAIDPILAIDVNFVSSYKDNGMTITYSNDNKTATLTFSGTCRFTDITVFYQFEEKARTGLSVGQIGTICQGKNILAVNGVVLYNVEYGNTQEITFKEITEFPIAAGTPAVFQASAADFEVIYGSETATVAVDDEEDGLVGLVQGEKVLIEEDNVLVSGGRLRLVGENCYLTAGHAYIKMEEVSSVQPVTSAPGRRLVLTNAEAQVITGLNAIQVSGKTRKMMINNQMVIIREGKMYNATGALMK